MSSTTPPIGKTSFGSRAIENWISGERVIATTSKQRMAVKNTKQPSESKMKHLSPGACAIGDIETARIKSALPAKVGNEARRRRIRNRKKLASLMPRTTGDELLRDSFKRARGG